MFNTRNKFGISAPPCIILYLLYSREERKEFIRAKYINHQYAQKLEESPSALSKVRAKRPPPPKASD